MPLLNVDGISTCLASEGGWVHAIDALSLSIEAGQTFALVGESGCGKSMTALSIARLLPDAGAVVAGRINLTGPSTTDDLLQLPESAMRRVRGKRIAMIFQEPGTSLNPVMTIGQQMTEAIELHTGVGGPEALDLAEQWLTRVGIPEPKARLSQYPFELSGGQKQRVMIAMALSVKPDVLIADEPTTALDVAIQAQVLSLLKQLQAEQGMAMLLITHDLGIVKHMADTVGLMYAGQLIEVAPAAEFFAKPQHPYAHALIQSLPSQAQRGKALYALDGRVPSLVHPPKACRFAERCAHAADQCREEPPNWHAVSAGHRVRCSRIGQLTAVVAPPLSTTTSSATVNNPSPVLQTVSLGVAYPERAGLLRKRYKSVLSHLDIALHAGRTVALVGESGSGKTTAARAVLGLLADGTRVDGDVLLDGKPLRHWPKSGPQGWRARVQFVFQDPFASLNPRHRVLEILEEPLVNLRPDLTPQVREARVRQAIVQVGLPEEALKRFPHEFSGGQRQRIAIARALVCEPQVLVCDEPTSALDVSVQAQILNLLKQLQARTGVAILFITHNLGVVQYFADEVVVLKAGAVVERGGAEALFEHPKHPYTRELIAASPVF
ncbi:dipeptide ABC transporter ATP-binding protein [Limnobacter humi]|uniref:Dipeptide ABC transporter ATP-binding protein n=1 Tax=Limnobacter humi TaxID=1778671 RepID=A0ABT1WFK3_9BURK|nr:dipeptide ABC transporter ATP-binding protein [Limnobacter humi]MCQ8896293.1 dipeptide ABC transporter ATP-binding protein [Limnobacter humi]